MSHLMCPAALPWFMAAIPNETFVFRPTSSTTYPSIGWTPGHKVYLKVKTIFIESARALGRSVSVAQAVHKKIKDNGLSRS